MSKTEFSGPVVSQGGFEVKDGVQTQNVAVATTNGTTNVSVFGANGLPVPITVTGVSSVALDTTASNITVVHGASTIVTIAKGTTAGATIGGVTLANAVVPANTDLQVDSSGAGNSRVTITYTINN